MVKLRKIMNTSYMFCYSDESALEEYEGKLYIRNTGIELDREPEIELDKKNCSTLHETSYEYKDEDYEIQGRPKLKKEDDKTKEDDETKVYTVESPAYVKINDSVQNQDGTYKIVKKTLRVGGLVDCLAVFITDGIYLIGYHLVSSYIDTPEEIAKKIQVKNLLKRFGMTPDNSKLLFYGQARHNRQHNVIIQDLASELGYNTYRVIHGIDSSIIFSNELLDIADEEQVAETKQE